MGGPRRTGRVRGGLLQGCALLLLLLLTGMAAGPGIKPARADGDIAAYAR